MNTQDCNKRTNRNAFKLKNFVSLFSFFLLLTSFQGFSQMNLNDPDTGTAEIGAEGCISIVDDNNGAVHNLYQLERIEQHFQDVEQLKKYLGSIENNRVAFSLNADESAIMMYVHKSRVPSENADSIVWWNSYISNSCITL